MEKQMVPTEPRTQTDAQPADQGGDQAQAVNQKIQELLSNVVPGVQTLVQVIAKVNPDAADQVGGLGKQFLQASLQALGLGSPEDQADGGADESTEQPQQGSQPVDAMGGAKGIPVA